jgi:hypothetical protein
MKGWCFMSEEKLTNKNDGNAWLFLKPLVSLGSIGFFGFFVAIGIAEDLNVGFGSMIGSPFDLLNYAFLGFVGLLSLILEFSWSSFITAVLENKMMWFVSLTVTALFLMIFFIDRSDEAVTARNEKMTQFYERHKNGHFAKILKVVASFLVFPVSQFLMFASVSFFLTLILLPMMLGMLAGKMYVREVVFKPEVCSPIIPYSERQAAVKRDATKQAANKGTSCGKVNWLEKQEAKSEAGRIVSSTANYVLLYKPKTGAAVRVPLTGQATFESVSIID